MKYCFGVDIGGTTVKLGLFTTDGEIVDKWEIKTRTENQGEAVLPDIAEALKEKLEEKKIGRDEVEGIGVGVPAPVNAEGVVQNTANLGWGYKEVKREMEELSGMRAEIGNDANVAALGELWKGGGAGHHNMIMVTLGTGVGGGIIINDKVIAGSHGAGGEIGHAHVIDGMQEACNCGNHGCLEQVASATGIARLAREALAATDAPSVMREKENISAKTVFDAVKENDAIAIQVAEKFGSYLGKALATFSTVADPEIIVIGGGVSKAGPILLDYIIHPFKEYAFTPCKETTKFALATLGNDAGIFGAAKLVL